MVNEKSTGDPSKVLPAERNQLLNDNNGLGIPGLDIHDWAWFVEMRVLCDKLDKKINELVKYVDACDKAGLSTPSDYEKHPLEDK